MPEPRTAAERGIITRRRLFFGATAFLVAPTIVRAASIMPVMVQYETTGYYAMWREIENGQLSINAVSARIRHKLGHDASVVLPRLLAKYPKADVVYILDGRGGYIEHRTRGNPLAWVLPIAYPPPSR